MKKENTILSIFSVIFVIAFVYLSAPIEDFRVDLVRDKRTVNGWERVSKLESPYFSHFYYDAKSDILWLVNSDDGPLLKINLADPENFQEAAIEALLVTNMCVVDDLIFIIEVENISTLVYKNTFELTDFTDIHEDAPYECLIDSQGNLIVYNYGEYWYGIYKQESWQFFDWSVLEEEGIELEEILGSYNGKLLLLTRDNQLFSMSERFDDLNYIGELPIQTSYIADEDDQLNQILSAVSGEEVEGPVQISYFVEGGIASNEMLWVTFNREFYGWRLPFDAPNIEPEVSFSWEEYNNVLDVIVDPYGRVWLFRRDSILVMLGQDDYDSINLPYREDRINSVYIDENSGQVFIGTESGIYRSTIDTLLEKNGLDHQ